MTLQETLDNQAKKYRYERFIDMLLHGEVDMVDIETPMMEYARACCKASLEKAADNANAGFNPFNSTCFVEKITITDPENIVLC